MLIYVLSGIKCPFQINLIRPFNRFVLVFKDKNPEDLLPKAEFIRQ